MTLSRPRLVVALLSGLGVLLPLLGAGLPVQAYERVGKDLLLLSLLTRASPLLLLWLSCLALTMRTWFGPPGRLWAATIALLGAALTVWSVAMPRDSLMWDGRDAQGRPTGGMEVAHLSWGALVIGLSGLLFVAAGVVAFLAARRHVAPASRHATSQRAQGPTG